jgi:hypothetical protein
LGLLILSLFEIPKPSAFSMLSVHDAKLKRLYFVNFQGNQKNASLKLKGHVPIYAFFKYRVYVRRVYSDFKGFLL